MPPETDVSAGAKQRTERPAGGGKASRRRGGRRSRGQSADGARYFVGRPADADGKPTLEQELASEPEALVIAFKNDSRVYFVSEYRVTQRIEGGQVRLEKAPVAAVEWISSINES
jgi:hypothetical protein